MNKNRLRALLHKQELKQVILSPDISSNDNIKQFSNTLDSKLNLLVDSSSNTIVKINQIDNTLDSKLNLLTDSSSNTIIDFTLLDNNLTNISNTDVDVSDIFLNNNVDILSDHEFQNILDNELNITTSFSEVFSNEINDITENNLDIRIATLLSNQYNFKNKEIDDLLKLNICNKKFYDEHTTTVVEFGHLITEVIKSIGVKNIISNMNADKCLFRNFSTYLNIDQKQLKEDSVNYILMKWGQFKDFAIRLDTLELYKSSDDYKSSMLKDDSLCDYLSVFALCELYQINAIIIITEGIQISNSIKINTDSPKTILIKC
jgi:hypothetical protein